MLPIKVMYGTMKYFLDIRRLRYLVAIADHASLSGAARSLRVAQPALSHHVRQIESAIGTKLLNRHSNGVTLTEAGHLLRRHAGQIINQMEQAQDELLALAAPLLKTQLRLAIIPSIAADLTPILLEEFARTVPNVSLRIIEAGTHGGLEMIQDGTADIAISLSPLEDSQPIAWEQLHLVCKDLGPDSHGTITFAQVLALPLILPSHGNPLREMLEAKASEICRSLNVVLEIDGPASRIGALFSGQGSTILGATTTSELASAPGLAVRPIVLPIIRRPLFLAARRGLAAELVEKTRSTFSTALSRIASLDVVDDS